MTRPVVGSSSLAIINLRAAIEILERDRISLLMKSQAVVDAFNGKDKPGWSPMQLKKAVMELEAILRE